MNGSDENMVRNANKYVTSFRSNIVLYVSDQCFVILAYAMWQNFTPYNKIHTDVPFHTSN